MGTIAFKHGQGAVVWEIDATGGALSLPLTVWNKNFGAGLGQGPFAIYQMQWISATAAAGDSVVVTDGFNNVIWQNTATGPNWDSFPVRQNDKVPIDGVIVTTLTSGSLFIWLA